MYLQVACGFTWQWPATALTPTSVSAWPTFTLTARACCYKTESSECAGETGPLHPRGWFQDNNTRSQWMCGMFFTRKDSSVVFYFRLSSPYSSQYVSIRFVLISLSVVLGFACLSSSFMSDMRDFVLFFSRRSTSYIFNVGHKLRLAITSRYGSLYPTLLVDSNHSCPVTILASRRIWTMDIYWWTEDRPWLLKTLCYLGQTHMLNSHKFRCKSIWKKILTARIFFLQS